MSKRIILFFRNLALVGAVLLLYSETMQEARTIFAGVPSMGDEPKGKVSTNLIKIISNLML